MHNGRLQHAQAGTSECWPGLLQDVRTTPPKSPTKSGLLAATIRKIRDPALLKNSSPKNAKSVTQALCIGENSPAAGVRHFCLYHFGFASSRNESRNVEKFCGRGTLFGTSACSTYNRCLTK